MARGIQNFPNRDTTDPTNYPGGRIKDDISGLNGTPVNELTNGDIQQFFYKLMELAGVTPNNLPDNVTNGYQYMSALQKLYGGGEWYPGGGVVMTPSTGTVTVDPSDIIYNRYLFIGNTMIWQIQLRNVTISTGCTSITLSMPTGLPYPFGTGSTFRNANMRSMGVYNSVGDMVQVIGSPAANKVLLTREGAASFTAGVNNQEFDINIIAELLP